MPFTIDALGRWSYLFCVSLYGVLLIRLLWYFRSTFRFAVRRFYVTFTVYALLVLGFLFEWIADIFFVWDFPEGRHLFKVPVPVFGWFTGHRVPIEELLWIGAVVPLFYFLYLYSTLLFHDNHLRRGRGGTLLQTRGAMGGIHTRNEHHDAPQGPAREGARSAPAAAAAGISCAMAGTPLHGAAASGGLSWL